MTPVGLQCGSANAVLSQQQLAQKFGSRESEATCVPLRVAAWGQDLILCLLSVAHFLAVKKLSSH